MVTRCYGEENVGSYCEMSTQFQFQKIKNVLEMDVGDGCTIL